MKAPVKTHKQAGAVVMRPIRSSVLSPMVPMMKRISAALGPHLMSCKRLLKDRQALVKEVDKTIAPKAGC